LDANRNPIYKSGIQSSIYKLFEENYAKPPASAGILRTHEETFEPAHKVLSVNEKLRFPDSFRVSDGKPYNANRYWKEILLPNYTVSEIVTVPIIRYMREIFKHEWKK
jgi:hypothetical protein